MHGQLGSRAARSYNVYGLCAGLHADSRSSPNTITQTGTAVPRGDPPLAGRTALGLSPLRGSDSEVHRLALSGRLRCARGRQARGLWILRSRGSQRIDWRIVRFLTGIPSSNYQITFNRDGWCSSRHSAIAKGGGAIDALRHGTGSGISFSIFQPAHAFD